MKSSLYSLYGPDQQYLVVFWYKAYLGVIKKPAITRQHQHLIRCALLRFLLLAMLQSSDLPAIR